MITYLKESSAAYSTLRSSGSDSVSSCLSALISFEVQIGLSQAKVDS